MGVIISAGAGGEGSVCTASMDHTHSRRPRSVNVTTNYYITPVCIAHFAIFGESVIATADSFELKKTILGCLVNLF